MTNRISKVIQNGTEYNLGGVDSVNGTTGAVTLKTVNNNALDGSGNISIEPGITKIFTLSSTSDLTTAQSAYDWYLNGGNPIIKSGNWFYHLSTVTTSTMIFCIDSGNTDLSGGGNGNFNRGHYITFTISSGSITGISSISKSIAIKNSAPTSGTTNNTITLVI